MPEQDARDTEPSVPATPRVSGEVSGVAPVEAPQPDSSLRAARPEPEPSVVSEPGDTLLSAGKPAERLELLVEDRFYALDERLRQLESRLAVLEQRKSIAVVEPRHKPWLWIAFLVGLAVIFQLLRWIR